MTPALNIQLADIVSKKEEKKKKPDRCTYMCSFNQLMTFSTHGEREWIDVDPRALVPSRATPSRYPEVLAATEERLQNWLLQLILLCTRVISSCSSNCWIYLRDKHALHDA